MLDRWPASDAGFTRFTTVASWRGAFGPVEWDGRRLRRQGARVPRASPACRAACGLPFEIALDIHPADAADRDRLAGAGWSLVAAGHGVHARRASRPTYAPAAQSSRSRRACMWRRRSGWFSDRSVRYLASGRPVLVQDTGFSRTLPVGEGLLAFRTPDEAARLARELVDDHARHRRAARALAEREFAPERALEPLLAASGVRREDPGGGDGGGGARAGRRRPGRVLQYALGLRRLGHRVRLVEQVNGAACRLPVRRDRAPLSACSGARSATAASGARRRTICVPTCC